MQNSDSKEIVVGSLQDIATKNNTNIAESFMDAEKIVLFDISSSMTTRDVPTPGLVQSTQQVDQNDPWASYRPTGRQRFEVAVEELKRIQGLYPGKIALVTFSTHSQFVAGGKPDQPYGMTDLAGALNYVLPADGAIDFIIISDGEPNSEAAALSVAMTMTSKIDTIYIGPSDHQAESFMDRLRKAPKRQGMYVKSAVDLLANNISVLMIEGGRS